MCYDKKYPLQKISSHKELNPTCDNANRQGTSIHLLNAKSKSLPPPLLAPISVYVEGAGCCCGAWNNWKAEKKNAACLNQPAGSEGMMGKQRRSPRSGWHDITNGGAWGITASVLLPLVLVTSSRLKILHRTIQEFKSVSLHSTSELVHQDLTGLSWVLVPELVSFSFFFYRGNILPSICVIQISVWRNIWFKRWFIFILLLLWFS